MNVLTVNLEKELRATKTKVDAKDLLVLKEYEQLGNITSDALERVEQ